MYGSLGYLLGVLLDRLLETCGQASWQRVNRAKFAKFKLRDRSISQRTLARIAQKAPLPEVRQMAMERLTDPARLARIAKTARAPHARQAAIEKLDPKQHQSLLTNIATHDPDPTVRHAARKKL